MIVVRPGIYYNVQFLLFLCKTMINVLVFTRNSVSFNKSRKKIWLASHIIIGPGEHSYKKEKFGLEKIHLGYNTETWTPPQPLPPNKYKSLLTVLIPNLANITCLIPKHNVWDSLLFILNHTKTNEHNSKTLISDSGSRNWVSPRWISQ